MSIIETPRLIVRRLERSDVPALVAIWSNADVTQYMGGPRDPDKVTRLLEDELASPRSDALSLWPVIEKTTGKVVGDCGLVYAFDRLGIERLVALIDPCQSSFGTGRAQDRMHHEKDTLRPDGMRRSVYVRHHSPD